jgi:hypothetical protein
MVHVDASTLLHDNFDVGPYHVTKSVVRFEQPMTLYRTRAEGRTTLSLTTHTGATTTCIVDAVDPWPRHLRAGVHGDVDGRPVVATKRRFRRATVRGDDLNWAIRSAGFGWTIVRVADGHRLAVRRDGRSYMVRNDLEASEVALVVALMAAHVADAAHPLAWLRGL